MIKYFFLMIGLLSSAMALPMAGGVYSSISSYGEKVEIQQAEGLKKVRFVDDDGKVPEYKREGQACWLQDSDLKIIIPDNLMALKKGDALLIKCPLSDLTSYHYFCLRETGGTSFKDCLHLQHDIKRAGWKDWWYVSESGPYFLLTAIKEGTVSFDVGYSSISRLNTEFNPYGKYYYPLLGHVTVQVE